MEIISEHPVLSHPLSEFSATEMAEKDNEKAIDDETQVAA